MFLHGVMRGLDPRIHRTTCVLGLDPRMDPRVKPAGDAFLFAVLTVLSDGR
jgi:hypothetical protein